MKLQPGLALLLTFVLAAPAPALSQATDACSQAKITDRENCRGTLANLEYRSRQRELVRQMGPVVWPNLPARGFIRGRSATPKDVEARNAVFSLAASGLGALDIHVPQYALWHDPSGQFVPALLVQAERGQGGRLVMGLRTLGGRNVMAELEEVELLGTDRPGP